MFQSVVSTAATRRVDLTWSAAILAAPVPGAGGGRESRSLAPAPTPCGQDGRAPGGFAARMAALPGRGRYNAGMFTGLVQALGTVRTTEPDDHGGRRFRVAEPGTAPQLAVGESVAVNGACMTV